MRIGILTGGGDAPGLNGIIESVSKSLMAKNHEAVGIIDGFEGIYKNETRVLTSNDLNGLHSRAGTFIGTSNKSSIKGKEKEFLQAYKKLNIDGLVVAGGDGTFSALTPFSSEIPLIGVPKTIDNDLNGTEITFGYDTACSVVSEAVDALRATADAHKRIIFVEVMGRTAGWIALGGGLASYADVILIPERPYSKDELLKFIASKKETHRGLICVVSEGAFAEGGEPEVAFTVENSPQKERYGGIAERLSKWVMAEASWESRHVVLGHLQRSKAPTTTDRFLTLAMGVEVGKMVEENDWGKAAVYRSGKVTRASITDLMKPARLIDEGHHWVGFAKHLGIFI